jgi:hypothetical protein
VAQASEVATAMKAACITAVLAAKTSIHEAAAARDITTLRVKDTEDRASLMEREAQERVSTMEAENAVALASAHEDAKGLVRKIALLEGELAEVPRA